jgi:hypothetical protein
MEPKCGFDDEQLDFNNFHDAQICDRHIKKFSILKELILHTIAIIEPSWYSSKRCKVWTGIPPPFARINKYQSGNHCILVPIQNYMYIIQY